MSLIDRAQELSERFRAADSLAQAEAEAIFAQKNPTPETVYPHLREYVRLKYMLTSEDMNLENIELLGKRSLERASAAGLTGSGSDVSPHCGSASSATHKKILLMLALQKNLHIRIEPRVSADCTTLTLLARAVCDGLEAERESAS